MYGYLVKNGSFKGVSITEIKIVVKTQQNIRRQIILSIQKCHKSLETYVDYYIMINISNWNPSLPFPFPKIESLWFDITFLANVRGEKPGAVLERGASWREQGKRGGKEITKTITRLAGFAGGKWRVGSGGEVQREEEEEEEEGRWRRQGEGAEKSFLSWSWLWGQNKNTGSGESGWSQFEEAPKKAAKIITTFLRRFRLCLPIPFRMRMLTTWTRVHPRPRCRSQLKPSANRLCLPACCLSEETEEEEEEEEGGLFSPLFYFPSPPPAPVYERGGKRRRPLSRFQSLLLDGNLGEEASPILIGFLG